MKLKTFWACTGCDKVYTSERWGLKHLTTGHDGAAWLNEFTPDEQQRLASAQLSDNVDLANARLRSAVPAAKLARR